MGICLSNQSELNVCAELFMEEDLVISGPLVFFMEWNSFTEEDLVISGPLVLFMGWNSFTEEDLVISGPLVFFMALRRRV